MLIQLFKLLLKLFIFIAGRQTPIPARRKCMWGWGEQHPKYSFQIILNYVEYFTNDLAANIQFFHDFFFSMKDVRRWRTQEGMRVDSLWGKEGGKQESRAVKGHQRMSKNSLMIWGGELFGSSPKPSTWAVCKYGTFGCSGNLGDDKSLTRGFNCPCWNRIRVLGSCWDARAASGNAATQISFFS